jgi:hypothetical protein
MWSVGIELQSFEEGKEAVVRSALDSVVGSQGGQGQLELQPSRARSRNCGRVWYSFRRPVRLQLTTRGGGGAVQRQYSVAIPICRRAL